MVIRSTDVARLSIAVASPDYELSAFILLILTHELQEVRQANDLNFTQFLRRFNQSTQKHRQYAALVTIYREGEARTRPLIKCTCVRAWI